MKRNIFWIGATVIFLIGFYMLFLRFPSVTYYGESEKWDVELKARLVGIEDSYEIVLSYKGTEKLDHVIFDIHPHYGLGWLTEMTDDKKFIYRCEGCGYYDQDNELLMFIKWKEDSRQLEYNRELFILEKK